MSTTELKEKLMKQVQLTSNDQLLEEAYRLLSPSEEDTASYSLNNRQQEAVREGQSQIADGKFLSNDDVDNEMEEWLKK